MNYTKYINNYYNDKFIHVLLHACGILMSLLFEQTAKQWSKLALFFSELSLTLQSMCEIR